MVAVLKGFLPLRDCTSCSFSLSELEPVSLERVTYAAS